VVLTLITLIAVSARYLMGKKNNPVTINQTNLAFDGQSGDCGCGGCGCGGGGN
jgi:hypothetical protein